MYLVHAYLLLYFVPRYLSEKSPFEDIFQKCVLHLRMDVNLEYPGDVYGYYRRHNDYNIYQPGYYNRTGSACRDIIALFYFTGAYLI